MEPFGVLFVVETHIFAEKNQEAETLDVIGVVLLDGLVNFQSFLEITDSALARGHHEFPLDLVGFDLTGPFEVEAGLFIEALFDVVDAKPYVGVQVHRKQPVGLKVVVKGLLLVVLSEKYVADTGKHSCVVGQFGEYYLIPLQSLFGPSYYFVDVCNLKYRLRNRNYRLNFLQCLLQGQDTWRASMKRLSFLLTKPRLYRAQMQSASTPMAYRQSSLALRKSFFMKRQLPLLTRARALQRSLLRAMSTYLSASLQFFSRKQRKEMFEATLLIVVLSFFSRPFRVSMARSISFFFKKAIALNISTSDSTQGQDEVLSFSRIHSQLQMTSFSMTGAISLAELMISLISSFLLALTSSLSLSLPMVPSASQSSLSDYSRGLVIMLVKQSFIRILSPVVYRQMMRLQAVLWSGEPLRICQQWLMASWYWPSLMQACPIFLLTLQRISLEVDGRMSRAILYIFMATAYFCWWQYMLPMLTLILPAKLYCFPFIISLYLVNASCSIPPASRHSAWFRATVKESSTFIRSAVLEFSLCFRRFFSLLVTSFAFSNASRYCPDSFRPTHSSRRTLISFSSFLKFSSGLLVFLAVRAFLYLVPYSQLALSWSLLEKPLPWLDWGRPEAPPPAVPPAREGVGLQEEGGGLT